MTPNVNAVDNPNSILILSETRTFEELPVFDLTYQMQAKVFRQEGDMKYEYNPFHNLLTTGETTIVNGVEVIKDKGKLTDFRVKGLGFNLNNPIEITAQPSYDGSVNLILNDDKNPPRMINSRFTTKEDARYVIVDRLGNNDTNIYKEQYIDRNTRLFRTSEKIPFIEFNGLQEGGVAAVGNYNFYFKYCDADGNETDIIAESSMVSLHAGKINDPFSIHGGLMNENSNKLISLKLKNLDTSFDYINVYFSRSTGDYGKYPITKYYKILNKKPISNQKEVEFIYTGFDNVEEISIDLLNIQYNIVDKVKTQAQVQNMLFLGNVDKPTIPHVELTDLALRIYPSVTNEQNIGKLDKDYEPVFSDNIIDGYEYYDVKNVYNFTGYWNKEIYRMGVVFILKDDSLSPVFNTRGIDNLGSIYDNSDFKTDIGRVYTHEPLFDDAGKRNYISVDEEGFLIKSNKKLENSKGVIRLNFSGDVIQDNGIYPLGLRFNLEDEVIEEIKKYAKGMFFVRQKRIPTILAQGMTIGVDPVANIPTIYADVSLNNGNKTKNFFTESFKNRNHELVHDFSSRLIASTSASTGGIVAPEVLLKSELFNNYFTASLFNMSPAGFTSSEDYFVQDPTNERHFFIEKYINRNRSTNITKDVTLTLIEDDKPLRYSGTKRFSTRAGMPEEAWRTSFFGREDKGSKTTTVIRGAYMGFIGMEGFKERTSLVDIHISGYDQSNMENYFKVRFNSADPFHAISNRYDFELLSKSNFAYREVVKNPVGKSTKFTAYRGDCYINSTTTRVQRNFQDPEVPISDTIVDAFTWSDNYKGFSTNGAIDSENLNKINRNDVNAVQMGHWITFKVCSSTNLAFRSVDRSNDSEYALTGKYRSFYPHSSMSTRGESKIPESTLYNAGNGITVPHKIYYTIPDVPYLKNIFDTRIMFSEIHITDAFRNGYRIFQGMDYQDVTRQYGGIVKLFNMRENLLCVFEHAVGFFPINREAIVGNSDVGGIYLQGVGVLPEKPVILSDIIGSIWQDSVIRTKNWIYGVDTIAKKIWRTDGQKLESLSDFRVQKFLNDNITLSEDDKKPMVGLKNVKTHYNAYKDDVIFTFYDTTRDDEENSWSLCYNEVTQKWITRYSWIPLASENVNNVWFSFDRDAGKKLAMPGYTNNKNEEALGITIAGKTESFDKVTGNDTVTRTQENAINIIMDQRHKIGDLDMKGYDYYKKYTLKYKLTSGRADNDNFEIVNDNELYWKGTPINGKYYYELQLVVELYSYNNGQETKIQEFNDILGVKVARNYIWSLSDTALLDQYDTEFSTWFWKHGQAGIFDISTPIFPTTWYDKLHPFEYEFVVVDSPATHKIFDNLKIISNNAEPDSFEFTVTKDVYKTDNITDGVTENHNKTQITTVQDKNVHTYQKALNIKTLGRMRGNMSYLEDFWDIEIKPNRFTVGEKIKEGRIRDKYCIVRVRYTGKDLALITALQTKYTISYA